MVSILRVRVGGLGAIFEILLITSAPALGITLPRLPALRIQKSLYYRP